MYEFMLWIVAAVFVVIVVALLSYLVFNEGFIVYSSIIHQVPMRW